MSEKESVYVVFGEHTERVAGYLDSQGYKVIGKDRTLDAAAIMAPNLDERPESYLVLGSALVSGVVDVGINYGAALIENLKRLRLAAPYSRIVLILPESVEPDVLQNILYMGIYDVYKTDSISVSQLPGLLSMRKTIADFGLTNLPMPKGTSERCEVELDGGKEDKRVSSVKALIEKIARLMEKVFRKSRKTKPEESPKPHLERESLSGFQYEVFPVAGASPVEEAVNAVHDGDTAGAVTHEETPQAIESQDSVPPPVEEADDRQEPQEAKETEKPDIKEIFVGKEPAKNPETALNAVKKSELRRERSGAVYGFFRAGEKTGKVVAVGSPWIDGGAPSFINLLSSCLSRTGRVLTLDSGDPEVDKKSMGARWVVVDAGDNPDTREFRRAASAADAFLWVVRDNFFGEAVEKWKARPRIRCREIMVLFGPGDPFEIEDAFVIPCFQVRSFDDKEGLERLLDILNSSGRGPRVLIVGFKEIPEIPGAVCDAFQTAEDAVRWVEYNPPDVVILRDNLGNLSLIEYDLSRYNIPVVRTSSKKLHEAIQSILR